LKLDLALGGDVAQPASWEAQVDAILSGLRFGDVDIENISLAAKTETAGRGKTLVADLKADQSGATLDAQGRIVLEGAESFADLSERPLELEADLGWSSLERDVIDPTGEDGPSPVSEADVGQYHALIRMQGSIVGRRTWNGLQPVVWAGLGLRGDFRGTQTGDLAIAEQYRYDTGTKFAATFGGMIRFIVADRWSARLEAGALLYRLDTPGGYSEEGLGFEAVGENEWVNAPSFGLSLGYRF